MPELLTTNAGTRGPLTPADVAAHSLLAVALGMVIAGVYLISLGGRRDGTRSLPTTLVLLAVLTSMVTMVIGNNLALAFGLVGALSIVRFRTVVEDTRDTSFVIFSVVVGMSVGAGATVLALVGIPVVSAAALIMCRLDRSGPSASLTVRLGPGIDADVLLAPHFAKHLRRSRLVSASTAKQGSAIDWTYEVSLRGDGLAELVQNLHRVEGIQGVELRKG